MRPFLILGFFLIAYYAHSYVIDKLPAVTKAEYLEKYFAGSELKAHSVAEEAEKVLVALETRTVVKRVAAVSVKTMIAKGLITVTPTQVIPKVTGTLTPTATRTPTPTPGKIVEPKELIR